MYFVYFRFPETLLAKAKYSSSKACPVPELKEDFLGLLAKMKRRGYIKEIKNESNTDNDISKVEYQLAVRYFVDIGEKGGLMYVYGYVCIRIYVRIYVFIYECMCVDAYISNAFRYLYKKSVYIKIHLTKFYSRAKKSNAWAFSYYGSGNGSRLTERVCRTGKHNFICTEDYIRLYVDVFICMYAWMYVYMYIHIWIREWIPPY
jgi:hypothetical protein